MQMPTGMSISRPSGAPTRRLPPNKAPAAWLNPRTPSRVIRCHPCFIIVLIPAAASCTIDDRPASGPRALRETRSDQRVAEWSHHRKIRKHWSVTQRLGSPARSNAKCSAPG